MTILNIILICLYFICAISVLYLFIFSVAGFFYQRPNFRSSDHYKKIAVLIPAYREDNVILQSARNALFQQYPSHRYDVFIIADSMRPETISALKKLPVQLIEVKFDKSTKAKALNEALTRINVPYDIAVILDADNIMLPDFLTKINTAFNNGCYAIQGHRMAKNKNTETAILDAISEEVNNHILRKGQAALGLSSSVIGSGMAFSFQYLKQVMKEIEAVGGFDKQLEITLIDDNHRIVYLDEACILDEKVQATDIFVRQRTRWIAAQFHFLGKYWLRGLYNLFTGRIDYANKIMHYALVPRMILLTIIPGMIITNILMPGIKPGLNAWIFLMTTYLTAYLIAIPRTFWNKQLLLAISSLPKASAAMMMAIFRVKNANKEFIHTPHSSSFDNPAKQTF